MRPHLYLVPTTHRPPQSEKPADAETPASHPHPTPPTRQARWPRTEPPFPLLTPELIAMRYDLHPQHPAVLLLASLARDGQRAHCFATATHGWNWLHNHPLRHAALPLSQDAAPARTRQYGADQR